MRAIRVASAALLGVSALALSAPAAVADDHYVMSNGYSVLPSTVAPGGQVVLQVDRDLSGCAQTVTVSSSVFDTVTIPPRRTVATAAVAWDASPGAVYRVTFTCGGLSAVKNLTVAGGRHDGPTPLPVSPYRGVHAGEGGSIAGFDLKEIGLGLALVTGSVAVAYRLSRRRAGEDGA
ncbi:hypothetical protein ABZT03_12180 [Streptomyces sp. NPDC005574]|uniref:hypothetical protein n=1 Tax=Streptomyces sp. NPDC005574 TaxID=3156891 RepID=UPI0033B216D2